MKKYRITVEGTPYTVEVEEVASDIAQASPSAPSGAMSAVPVSAPAEAVSDKMSGPAEGAGTITAPMPGTVLSVAVSAGQSVTAGDVLLILEAMKMENEILAPADGVVTSVPAIKGTAVNAGDVLVVMR